MKKSHYIFALLVISLAAYHTHPVFAEGDQADPQEAPATQPQDQAQDQPDLTLKQRVSYIIGMQMAMSVRQQGFDLEPGMIAQGLTDLLQGEQAKLNDEQIRQTMTEFQQTQLPKQQEKAQYNLQQGQEFMETNKQKEGVTVLPSGLQYEVLEEGTGRSPSATDRVKTHYRGTLIDGTEFDSSYSRGQPAVFPVNGVISGWTEALQLMKEGSKWRLVIPSNLAYGERGAGPKIGPNATLVFEVELLSIEN